MGSARNKTTGNRISMRLVAAFLLAFLSFTSLLEFVRADIGPKPSMSFDIVYETTNPVKLISGEQMECKDASCSESRPLGRYGPQEFICGLEQNSCRSMAYGYEPYHKLVLNFSDGKRESNVFRTESFYAQFKVRVKDSELVVEEITPIVFRGKNPSFILALFVTLILELITVSIFLPAAKNSKRILISVILANLISLPTVWFLLPLLNLSTVALTILSEGFAAVFEAYFIHLLNKKTITLRKSFMLSLLANAVSFFIGGFIVLVLGMI